MEDHDKKKKSPHLQEAVTAMQLGNRLGHKAGKVLAYLNTRRAPNHESYTIPVGYGQISGAAGVDTKPPPSFDQIQVWGICW
jgi:hypothetical protein